MNVIIFDKPNHLLHFEVRAEWVKEVFLSENFLEPSGLGRETLLAVLRYIAQQQKNSETAEDKNLTSRNITAIDLSKKGEAKKLLATRLAPEKNFGMTLIDCVNKKMVSVNQAELVDRFSFIGVELLFDHALEEKSNRKMLECYKCLLTKNYMAGPEEEKNLLISRIKTYLKKGKVGYHKNSLNKAVFTVNEATTGWRTYSNTNYSVVENYQKLNEILLSHNIFLTNKQKKSWENFIEYKVRKKIKLDFWDEQCIEKEQRDLLGAIKTSVIATQLQPEKSNTRHKI